MNFTFDINIPLVTVFLQGILSFLSPCVFPLVPLYLGYLAGGKKVNEEGKIEYPRKQAVINSIFFVIGISFTFFLLGFGFTALGQVFNSNRILFARISGIIMILFGLYQFGLFGHSQILEREHRVMFAIDKWTMGPIPALLLGFTFSFAWTPCVGPILGSVVLMAGTTGTMMRAAGLIAVYSLGFGVPFLAVGIFTTSILELFQKHRNIIKYTVKLAAALMILMGIMTFTGFMNNITSYLSTESGPTEESEITEEIQATEGATEEITKETESTQQNNTSEEAAKEQEEENEKTPAPEFTLLDQNGETHTLSDYKGKTIFLNFWATWCPPCKGEMPDIQAIYENYGYNEEELVVLGVAGPNMGSEGDISYITDFLTENGYSFPVLMDESGDLFSEFGIYSYPTTFMIDTEGDVFGYVSGAMTTDTMESIIRQTMEGKIEKQ